MFDFYEKISLFEDEDVRGVFRLSSVTVIRGLFLPLLGFFLTMFLMSALINAGGWGVLIFLSLLLVVGLAIAHHVVKWYGTLFIITNRRVFRIVRHGLFKKDVDELSLDIINSVRYTTKGILETIFRTGTVHIAFKDAARKEAELYFIDNPSGMLDTISRLLHGQPLPTETPVVTPKHAIVHEDSDLGHHVVKEESTPKPIFKERSLESGGDVDIASIWKE